MHVAKIETSRNGKVYVSHLLRRTYREGKKVKHQTLGNLSHLPDHVIDLVRRALRGEAVSVGPDAFEVTRTRPHGHVVAALGALRHLGLDSIIAARRSRERDLAIAMIVARILDPRSKLATAQGLRPESLESTLGEVLGLESADENELYAAMDWLLERQEHIQQSLAERHFTGGSLVLYDVSSSWFEGRSCPLARLGHSRDGKKDKLQIVYGLLCDDEGCPVAIEVFEGNTGDPNTIPAQIRRLKRRFRLERIVIVGDRGMLTEARIREDLEPEEGIEWVTALRSPAIRGLFEGGYIQHSLFDERDLAEVSSPDFPGERLVVCRNPVLADERTRKREELLQATATMLERIAVATQRKGRSRLRGKDRIGLRVGKVLSRFKMAKHFRLHIGESSFSYERDEEAIAAEQRLDGFYVIRTRIPESQMSASKVVRTYKSLSKVERAFRSMKTVDLKIRPIHHRLADRVRAHVFLCMLAYYVEWNMRKALAPLIFDDESPTRQRSPVASAKRSASALKKASKKRNADGDPVESFQGLLRSLRTVARNRMRSKGAETSEFEIVTTPTPTQQKALELLGVAGSM